jgi:crossover junction endodeoxyribonuclease RuvC
VIQQHRPAVAAIEEPFVAANVRSAFAIGEARAVALLAAASEGVEVCSYPPAAVKETVTGYGRGDKRQVQEMVRLQLRLERPPAPFDAADALAIALCHALRSRLEARL